MSLHRGVATVTQHGYCKLVKPTINAELTSSSMVMQHNPAPASQALDLKDSHRAVQKWLQMQACCAVGSEQDATFEDSKEHGQNSTESIFCTRKVGMRRWTVLLL